MAASVAAPVTPKKWTLKVEWQDEIRRQRPWPNGDIAPTLETLQTSVRSLLGFHPSDEETLTLKYRDDEGDLCTITDATFADALTFVNESGVFRVIALRAPTACTAPPNTPVACEAPCEPNFQPSVDELTPPSATPQTDHISHAAWLVSEQLEEVSRNFTEHAAEVQQSASEQFQDLHRHAAEQFENSRPHLAEGFERFKRQVRNDFNASSQDMSDAFGPVASDGGVKRKVRTVTSAATGVVAAARLVPVRATRLAAHSVAAVVGTLAHCDDAVGEQTEQADPTQSFTEESGVLHFKRQVLKDFKDVQSDVKASCHCILGENTPVQQPSGTSEHVAEQQSLEEWNSPTRAIPEVLSHVVGASAAACLMPLRAARLAVFAAGKLANNYTPDVEITGTLTSAPGGAAVP